jgi:hypothetical protein
MYLQNADWTRSVCLNRNADRKRSVSLHRSEVRLMTMMSRNEHLHGNYQRRRMNVGWKRNANQKRRVSLHRSEVRLMMTMMMSKNGCQHGMYRTMTTN